MPAGETQESPSAWTIDSAMQHLNERIDALSDRCDRWFVSHEAAQIKLLEEMDRRYEQRFHAQEQAISKQDEATEKRFEGVNEFRGQLADQATRFMPRAESVARHDATAAKITDLDVRERQDVQAINSRLDLSQGGSAGADKFRATLFAMLAAAAAIVGIAFAIAGRN